MWRCVALSRTSENTRLPSSDSSRDMQCRGHPWQVQTTHRGGRSIVCEKTIHIQLYCIGFLVTYSLLISFRDFTPPNPPRNRAMRHALIALLSITSAACAIVSNAPLTPRRGAVALSRVRRPPRARLAASALSRALLGDPSKAPLRSVLKTQLQRKTASLFPEEIAELALDQAFDLLPKLVPGGLDRLLQPGELQRRRNSLRDDLSSQLAKGLDTPLGDELEKKLGAMVVDLILDDLIANSDFLRSPEDRLAGLDAKVADTKAEMGLLRVWR
jgi:hypothetical protein